MTPEDCARILATYPPERVQAALEHVIGLCVDATSNAEELAELLGICYRGVGRPHVSVRVESRDRVSIVDLRAHGLIAVLEWTEDTWLVTEPEGLDVGELAWIGG